MFWIKVYLMSCLTCNKHCGGHYGLTRTLWPTDRAESFTSLLWCSFCSSYTQCILQCFSIFLQSPVHTFHPTLQLFVAAVDHAESIQYDTCVQGAMIVYYVYVRSLCTVYSLSSHAVHRWKQDLCMTQTRNGGSGEERFRRKPFRVGRVASLQ